MARGTEQPAAAALAAGSSLLACLRAYFDERPCAYAYEVARSFAMSQRTLQRRLRALGTSFQRETEKARLRIAKKLMEETDQSLKYIALESGYASLQHFSSSFRARERQSPSAWRAGRRASTEKKAGPGAGAYALTPGLE
ncbi:MAG TPA: helix-turn-helix transcriptional regulator [Polyangia bacterium]|nr:helix-turn-helix transcriptional regulator [Polyangia bacterium]